MRLCIPVNRSFRHLAHLKTLICDTSDKNISRNLNDSRTTKLQNSRILEYNTTNIDL